MKIKLKELFTNIISGEWGEDDIDDTGIPIIRTANFLNDGKINYDNLVTRRIVKRILDENNQEVWIIDEEKIESKKLQDGDIIIEKSGGGVGTPVGRVVYFTTPDNRLYLSNNFTQTLRVNKNIAHPKYVFYLFKYLYKKGTVLKYQNQTTGIFNLKLERYFEEEITLPSLDIQYSFSIQLDTVQDLIDKRVESIKLLDSLVNSYYHQLFGHPIYNPKNWKKKKLSQIGIWRSGGTPNTQIPEYYEGSIPWFTSGELGNAYISQSIKCISEEALKKSNAKLVPKNSLLIGMYDTAAFKLSINKVECTCNQAICYSQLENDYYTLFVYFTLLLSKDYYLSKRKGARQKNLSTGFIKNIEIIFPSTEVDNKLIAKFYSFFDTYFKQTEIIKISVDSLEILLEAILQNVFRENKEIDEEPIFKELIKKFTLDDLRGHKQRLQYLINLFEKEQLENLINYSDAREKLFSLMAEEEIIQVLNNDKITLKVK